MVFSSAIFIFGYLPCLFLIYFFIGFIFKKVKIFNVILIFFSIVFCAWGGINTLINLAVLIIINYNIGKVLYIKNNKKFLILGIIINVLSLLLFKYMDFLFSIKLESLLAPIGLSYYVFSSISYNIDIYRRKTKPASSLSEYFLYSLFFPKFISGPIIRYSDIQLQLQKRTINLLIFREGVERFIIGFSKKILLSNRMSIVADAAFNGGLELFSAYAWLGAICYTLQLYFDFSGYSDMAIGLGKMLGFQFLENFNYPYMADSIKDFWRRWHITLSLWFRDYVYIPLGGNRNGKIAKCKNLLVVFILTGLWHGASWNFVVWGLYHGILLIIESLIKEKSIGKMPLFLRRVYCFIAVVIGWVLFRANGMTEAIIYLKNMFNFNLIGIKNFKILEYFTYEFIFCFIICCFACTPVLSSFSGRFRIKSEYHERIYDFAILMLFFLSLCFMMGDVFNPFIYMKF